MYISEYNFDHLRHAADERLARELELRRIARERRAENRPSRRGGGLRDLVQRLSHPGHPSPRRLSHT